MNASFSTEIEELTEGAAVPIHEIDLEGIIRSVNQAECRLLGYAPHQMIGHFAWEFVAAEHRDTVRAGIARKLAREQPIAVFVREFRRADGTYLWVEVHETLIENAAGEVIGIRSGLFDVTERHKFEREIQIQNNRMKCLLRSWTRAIITADALGHVDFMNPAAEALTGWPQADAIGRPVEAICRLFGDSGEPVDLMSCLLAGPGSSEASGRSPFVDRAGTESRVSWVTSPISNDNGVMIGAAVVLEKY